MRVVFVTDKRSIAWRLALTGVLLAISLLCAGQLYIGPGAQLQVTGNASLTLKDMDLVNNGQFLAGNGTFYFSGAGNFSVRGTQPVQFYSIQINKDPGARVLLQRPIGISSQVLFSQGLVDLNGYDLDLGSTGQLVGESENSRLIGAAGGEVLFTTTLNAPANSNPGNLGALISSSRNLGSVLVKRGHKAQNLTGSSLLRYYHITPTNNSNLGATLRFSYFDGELNNLPENDLVLWRSVDGLSWLDQRRTGFNVAQNYVEKTGIDAFSIWTLAVASVSLPVVFTGFHVQCDDGRALLHWKTAQESNSSHFIIERNSGAGWMGLGQLVAAGNSSVEKSYAFADLNPVEKAQYRIAQYDLDGRVTYTSAVIFNCALAEVCQVGPNPFLQTFTLRIQSSRNDQAYIKVMDARGVVVVKRSVNLLRGVNQFDVDLHQAASGAYLLTIEWVNDRQLKTIRLVKQ
ncbi:T9SS type A sorting domain-containing protein [Paraflavitalea sp. CAU 1676]|uniref:T9SS type A sorting domain-containing protein n=1 Tax=Paraflavitalea sp. CAU 1676 TaxID=3032598 RepID=UPI0023DBCE59|nr:T9SS type A sorting domain-containing protein [Paraflavitalea sp. CAU 1676]MDF2187915.1 T9SS type A sorting domain-containing protein [Paraflavitalea sp. CAU 1676]